MDELYKKAFVQTQIFKLAVDGYLKKNKKIYSSSRYRFRGN